MEQEIKIKVHVKGQPQDLVSFINCEGYEVQANWYAKMEGRPLPYPEIEPKERPKLKGEGLLEQITNKTYHGQK